MNKLLPLLILLVGCSNGEPDIEEIDAQSYLNRNLALAYIDIGMMAEAGEKLAILETLMPQDRLLLTQFMNPTQTRGLSPFEKTNLKEQVRCSSKRQD